MYDNANLKRLRLFALKTALHVIHSRAFILRD